jgi:starch synthase/alpha-amylase
LDHIEDRGIDAAYFWQHLYYLYMATDYESTRSTNPVDFLVSGVFAAHFVNTVSPRFLEEIVAGYHSFVEPPLRQELINKHEAGCAAGILNAPDPAFNPAKDPMLSADYTPDIHREGKRANKLHLQKKLGLDVDEKAPVFFWPSRLDPVQKGCELLAHIFYEVISVYWKDNLQMVFVANGEYQPVFRDIIRFHGIEKRAAVCDFNEDLEHLSYAAADFVLMPSRFEPCGLPQMIGPIYGALTVAHDTGGLHNTVEHLDIEAHRGNGFIFEHYDPNGLFWGIGEAMRFYRHPPERRAGEIARIMRESAERFTHQVTARQYIKLYEKMLDRPLVV